MDDEDLSTDNNQQVWNEQQDLSLDPHINTQPYESQSRDTQPYQSQSRDTQPYERHKSRDTPPGHSPNDSRHSGRSPNDSRHSGRSPNDSRHSGRSPNDSRHGGLLPSSPLDSKLMRQESGGALRQGLIQIPSQNSLFSEEDTAKTNTQRRTLASDRQDSQSLLTEQFNQSERYIPSPLDGTSQKSDHSGSGSARHRILDLVPAPLDAGEGVYYNDGPGSERGSDRHSRTPSEGASEDGVSSIAERVKNAEPMLRQGSEYNLLGNRYGSMQSIPENELPRSDVFGSEVYHIKDSLATESVVTETESNLLLGNTRTRKKRGETSVQEEGQSSSRKGGREHSVGSTSSTAFINAAEKGDIDMVRKALDNPNLDPDRKTKYQSRSALHLAAGYGQYAVSEELLYAGADPVALSQTGRTPLHEACAGGHEKVLQLLLDYTREFDLKDVDGRTPSHMAAFHGEVKCLEVLVDKGAAQVISDKAGRQPAHLAAMRDHRNILEYLYDKGIDLACRDSQGKLPVHYAAQYGALDLLICLVERECDITLEDYNGNLPIHFAAWNDHLDCVRFLIKQGSSMEVTQSDGRTPAHVAAAHGSHKVLHWLCSRGANVDALDNLLNTPLHLAGEAGKPKCFNCLLQHDSDLNAVNKTNDTPFNSAKKTGHKLCTEKAISNELACPLCKQKFEYEEWQDLNGPAPVLRTVTQMGKKAFINPVPRYDKTKTAIEISAEKRRKRLLKDKRAKERRNESLNGTTTLKASFLTQSEMETTKKRLPSRDLSAKYFGEYLTNEMYKLKI